MKPNNISFSIWCTDPISLLVDKQSLEQLIKALPDYSHTFGEAVTTVFIHLGGDCIRLDEYDIYCLNRIYELDCEIISSKIWDRKFKSIGSTSMIDYYQWRIKYLRKLQDRYWNNILGKDRKRK